jgi:signal transduction histidine kinase
VPRGLVWLAGSPWRNQCATTRLLRGVSGTTGDSMVRRRGGGPRRLVGQGGWSLRTQLVVIVAAVMMLFGIVFSYVATVTLHDAGGRARRDATYQAGLAARGIVDAITQGETAAAGVAAGLDVPALLAHPSGCTLSFAGLGVFPSGHVDLVVPDGRVVCSSLVRRGAPPRATQAGAAWVKAAATDPAPSVSGVFTDRLTGRTAIAVTAPTRDRAGHLSAITAFVVPVGDLAAGLAATYGGPQRFAFAATDATGQRLLAGSRAGGAERGGRIAGWRPVPGLGWRVYASERAATALGPTRDVLVKEAALAGAAFLVMLLLLAVVNRRIVGPVRQLISAVGQATRRVTHAPVPASGPSELRLLAEEFNRMVTTRDSYEAELAAAHEALQRYAAELERATADLEQFTYSTSHDLIEPLRTITSYAQLLQRSHRDRIDAEGEQAIEFMVEGATRMHGLIDGVLGHSQAARGELLRTSVDVATVVREALRSLQPSLEGADARVEVGWLPHVRADRIQLGRVIQNLVDNALKFHGDEPPRIHIAASREQGGWRLSVADNGIGIDPAHRDRVFHMFQRLNDRTRYPGAGVGLAVCQRIVERHGGRIWVEAGSRGGSVFHFTIPDAEEAIPAAAPKPTASASGSRNPVA